ncbi:MAG: ATP-dependent helicase, partial [Candidatus Eremiobacteraeota bacterium]|nr:ATP-dependent helicase [Candidatus Eremiobacteraeota bacterium]
SADRLAVLLPSLRGARRYVDALLRRDLPVRLVGDLDLFVDPCIEDALSLLWATHDPFRHDWLLRALQTPTVRLADASLAAACGEPAQAQAALFSDLPESEGDGVPRPWDRERDIRLGRNLTRGDRDLDLLPETRERIVRFRALRERWQAMAANAPLEDVARLIFAEGGLFEPEDDETAARTAYRRTLLERLIDRIAAFAGADRRRTLGDLLRYLETTAASDWSHCDPDAVHGGDGVVVAQIDAIKGCTYEEVFIPDLRAGAFPPYWVPDAFVFTTRYGIVPKDNVGDARAARTAKFTWYQHNAQVRDRHAAENRRLLYCAMTRATSRVWLGAFGPPTRGVAAPELLAELQSALNARC